MTYRWIALSATVLSLAATAAPEDKDRSGGAPISVPEEQVLPLVSVAGLRPVAAKDLTTSVSILEARDLAVRASPFVADQLRTVPGLGVSRSGALGGLTQVRMRGAEANHTLVLIDGVEVSDPTTGETDFGVLSGLGHARIEVLRGEQSGLYGSDAIGGVILIETDPTSLSEARVEAGSRDTWRADAAFGLGSETGALRVAFGGFETDGVDTSGRGGEEDGSTAYSGLVTGRADLGYTWGLKGLARYGYGRVETDPDVNFDGRLDDADRVTGSNQWTLGAVLTGAALGADHQLRASFNRVDRENFADGALSSRSEGDRTKLTYSPSVMIRPDKMSKVRLAGLLDYEREDYTVSDTEFFGLTNQDQSFETLGAAAEALVDFGAFAISGSVRFDENDGRFDDAVAGRLGVVYASDRLGLVRASVGTGVKNPTLTELFGFFPGSFVGNPDLKPETSTSYELGWSQSFGTFKIDAALFQAELENEIFTDFNPDFTSTARNRDGDSKRSGLELALRWQPNDEVSFAGQVTVIDSESDTGDDEVRVPAETGSLSVDYRPALWQGIRVGLALDYVGEQIDTDFGTFPATRVTLDSYVLASATAEFPITDGLALTLRGENLFDETATDVLGYSGPGAGVFLGVKVGG